MSAQRISLKSKPVIAGVLALLAIVVAVNVVVFKPGSRRAPRCEVRVQASQTLPADLGDFRHGKALPANNLAAWGVNSTPVLRRDPFGRDDEDRAIAARATVALLESAPDSLAKIEILICNAVLLDGVHPAAVISGKSYRLGDGVQEYTVAAIGTAGVQLAGLDGPDMFLSVNTVGKQPRQSRIVNESTGSEGLAGTSLVEHARGERK